MSVPPSTRTSRLMVQNTPDAQPSLSRRRSQDGSGSPALDQLRAR
ncbi:MAG TPA: hypothetical protein VGB17_15845 [Pyrinomonadaceae bacterium]